MSAHDHFSYRGGKRICVGLHLAERSLFTMTSRLLQAFDIQPATGPDGRQILVNTSLDVYKTGLICSPLSKGFSFFDARKWLVCWKEIIGMSSSAVEKLRAGRAFELGVALNSLHTTKNQQFATSKHILSLKPFYSTFAIAKGASPVQFMAAAITNM